jgi:hypothetical protein
MLVIYVCISYKKWLVIQLHSCQNDSTSPLQQLKSVANSITLACHMQPPQHQLEALNMLMTLENPNIKEQNYKKEKEKKG